MSSTRLSLGLWGGSMRAGVFLGRHEVSFSQIPDPECHPQGALIRVSYAGICGTDMMIYAGKHPRAKAPLVMGHEFCGTVFETTADEFRIGDRVVVEPTLGCGSCNACTTGNSHVCSTLRLVGIDQDGGFAEFVAVPLDRLHRIPDDLDDSFATLAEPFAVGVHTLRRSALRIGDVAVVLGAGPIGLIVALMARTAGAREVVITDVSPYRLSVARKLGFTVLDASHSDNVMDAVTCATKGLGADVVFEVAGTQITADQMIKIVRTQGQLMVVSVFKNSPILDLAAMHYREITLTTTRCYSSQDFDHAIRYLVSHKEEAQLLVSHQLPLERVDEGFQLMATGDASLKILLRP